MPDMLGVEMSNVNMPPTFTTSFGSQVSAVGPYDGVPSIQRTAGYGDYDSSHPSHISSSRWPTQAYGYQEPHDPDSIAAPETIPMPYSASNPESSLFPGRPWYGDQNG